MRLDNYPEIRLGLVAVSRNNFHKGLSQDSRDAVCRACADRNMELHPCGVIVEDDADIAPALDALKKMRCNALIVLLGNFGPEGPASILASRFGGPVMAAAAAEESGAHLYDARRDAFCGLMNFSYNLDLRHGHAYIPEEPVGSPEQIAEMIGNFLPIARVKLGLTALKMISFGPRPRDFYACNAPIKGLYDLGVEVEENSELDLLLAYEAHVDDARIPQLVAEMCEELRPVKYRETLTKFAQYELTLLDWAAQNRGARQYVAFANKCWPAFQKVFGFLPCYVHGRMMAKGYPVGCETDLYGGLSEYIGACVSGREVALLDMNNNLPADVYTAAVEGWHRYRLSDLFIGYHCGNTSSSLMACCELKYKLDRKNPHAAETGREDCRGTLEGRIREGEAACFRLHAGADGGLKSYVAEGEILPVETKAYGSYAVIGVPGMARFYRHVLIGRQFPHHTVVVPGGHASALYEVLGDLGLSEVSYNQPEGIPYPGENPFARAGVVQTV